MKCDDWWVLIGEEFWEIWEFSSVNEVEILWIRLRTMPWLNKIFTESKDCCDVIINMIVVFDISILFHFTRLRAGLLNNLSYKC